MGSKCELFMSRIKYLGQVIDEKGQCPDTAPIKHNQRHAYSDQFNEIASIFRVCKLLPNCTIAMIWLCVKRISNVHKDRT